jgi:hypothetical protein
MTRRQFQAAALAFALGGARRAGRSAEEGRAGPHAFLALGDLHFDRPEDHDHDWLRRDHPNDVPQVENYSRITREVLPDLFAELRQVAASSKVPVTRAVQLGDLIEGMCGSPELATRQCEGVAGFLRGAGLGVPFVAVKGNHEIQGPGAADAYRRVLLPFMADQAGLRPEAASFIVEAGDSLFIFLDAYDPDHLPWLERALAAREARHVFVLLHPPVVPFGARSLWHIDANPADAPRRNRLLNLLGAHRAIVLCGHLHRYGIVVRETEGGRFLQLALCSVIPKPDARVRDLVEGVDRYGPGLVELEPKFSPDTVARRREALRAEAPFIKHFEHADAPGYALITVADREIRADIYLGLGRRLWRSLDLKALLAG